MFGVLDVIISMALFNSGLGGINNLVKLIAKKFTSKAETILIFFFTNGI